MIFSVATNVQNYIVSHFKHKLKLLVVSIKRAMKLIKVSLFGILVRFSLIKKSCSLHHHNEFPLLNCRYKVFRLSKIFLKVIFKIIYKGSRMVFHSILAHLTSHKVSLSCGPPLPLWDAFFNNLMKYPRHHLKLSRGIEVSKFCGCLCRFYLKVFTFILQSFW